MQDSFITIAERMVIYQLRSKWLAISKLYNEMASDHGGTMSMAFILLAINEEKGTLVTKIAPRMGMEPNSLSRILKSMEKKGFIYRQKDKIDKRKVHICLTDYGFDMRKIALNAVVHLEEKIQHQVTEEKMEVFFEVMQKVPNALKQFEEEFRDS